ncbi:hypothetical protein [Candidatus Nitrosocosmicus sp. FF01]|uniref:hypothetical protein n=1 Tax=Candidatus Nitrosocosmicus sp. FF01 TaxID=3397670 RepID=UPI0039E72C31
MPFNFPDNTRFISFFNNLGELSKEVIDSRIQMVIMLNARALIPAIVSPMMR